MEEWSSYRLEDFLLFSPRTYFRLVEIHQEAIWPAQVLALVIGIALALLLWSRRYRQAVPALLAVCWFFVAWTWFHRRYATINWTADHGAVAFAIEGALLVLAALSGGWRIGNGWTKWAGLGLFLVALLLPFLAPLAGRSWTQLELFGTMPDPTAVGTLALLVAVRGWWRWVAVPIPLIWCLVSGATLAAMDAPEAWLSALLAGCAVLLALASLSSNPPSSHHGEPIRDPRSP